MSILRSVHTENVVYPAAAAVEPEERLRRLSLAVLTAAAVGIVLLWGSLLVLGAGVGGEDVCTDYIFQSNPRLFDWCQGNSWQGWAPAWSIGAFLIVAGARVLAGRRRSAWPIYAAIPLACIAVWVGLAVPQVILS